MTYNLDELARIGTPQSGFVSHSGDFSAVVLLVSRMALAAQPARGPAVTGGRAGLRALCDTRAWANWMRTPGGPDKLTLSPNDLDKAVYEVMASPLPASDAVGAGSTAVIDQVHALYIEVVLGGATCGNVYS